MENMNVKDMCYNRFSMEGPLYIHLIIEELKLGPADLSYTKLVVKIEAVTKEFHYPYRDIYFQLPNKYTLPSINLSFTSKILIEGNFQLKSLKNNEIIRVNLYQHKDLAGYTLIKFSLLEHLSKEICRHCVLCTEIVLHSSKSAKKLSNLENRLIDQNLGLEINLKSLENKDAINRSEVEYVKNLLLGAHEKLKAFEITKKPEIDQNIFQGHTATEATIDYNKIINTLEQEISNQNRMIDTMHAENKTNTELYLKEKAKNKEIFEELEALKLENNVLKGEMIKIRANRRKTGCAELTIDGMMECKKQSDLEVKNIRELYQRSVEEFSSLTKGYEDTLTKLKLDKEAVDNVKDKLLIEIKGLKCEKSSLNSNILVLKSEIAERDARIKVFESMNTESLAEQLIKENVTTLYQKIEGDVKRFNEFSKLMRKEKSEILQQLLLQTEDIKIFKEKIDSLETNLRQTHLKKDDLLIKLNTMKQKIHISRVDLEVSNEMKEIKTQALEMESTLNKQLEFLIKFNLEISQKFLFQQKLISKMFKFVQDKDCEICILRHKIIDQQGSMNIYIPEKADSIDIAMGDYINTRPSFLEVPFIRMEQGVYLFGTKIVKVKLQNGRLIMCMGGGFMSIDEFISIFTPLEIEKLNERKKNDLASEMKALVGDSLGYINVDEAKSPVDFNSLKKKIRNDLLVNSALNNSRDSSKNSISSPVIGRRSLTRKSSLANR